MVRGKKARLVVSGLLASGLLVTVEAGAQEQRQDTSQQEDTRGQDTLDPVDPFEAGTEEESGTGGAGEAGQDRQDTDDPARPLNESERLEDEGQLEDEDGSLDEERPLDEPGTGGAGDTGTGPDEVLPLDEDEGVFPREPLDGNLPDDKGVR